MQRTWIQSMEEQGKSVEKLLRKVYDFVNQGF